MHTSTGCSRSSSRSVSTVTPPVSASTTRNRPASPSTAWQKTSPLPALTCTKPRKRATAATSCPRGPSTTRTSSDDGRQPPPHARKSAPPATWNSTLAGNPPSRWRPRLAPGSPQSTQAPSGRPRLSSAAMRSASVPSPAPRSTKSSALSSAAASQRASTQHGVRSTNLCASACASNRRTTSATSPSPPNSPRSCSHSSLTSSGGEPPTCSRDHRSNVIANSAGASEAAPNPARPSLPPSKRSRSCPPSSPRARDAHSFAYSASTGSRRGGAPSGTPCSRGSSARHAARTPRTCVRRPSTSRPCSRAVPTSVGSAGSAVPRMGSPGTPAAAAACGAASPCVPAGT
eukprot:jgi/Mesvir1/3544/Mv25307-RA.1